MMRKPQQRECQPCTVCCDGWVQIVIDEVEVYPGHPCPHSTGQGCDDYDNRPEDPCRRFICGWAMENSPLPEWMKPNEAKVLVLFDKLHWRGLPVDLAVPVGRRIPARALEWLQRFAETNRRPLIYAEQLMEAGCFLKEQELFGYGPPEFQAEVVRFMESGKKLW